MKQLIKTHPFPVVTVCYETPAQTKLESSQLMLRDDVTIVCVWILMSIFGMGCMFIFRRQGICSMFEVA